MEPEVIPAPTAPAPERFRTEFVKAQQSFQIQARREKILEVKEEVVSGKLQGEPLQYKLSRDERLASRKAAKPRNIRKAERAALELTKEEGNQ